MPGDALVPPLVLQPLLENSVYHGIEPSSTPGVVSINIFCKGGDVHAILRNPYRSEGGRHHAGNKMVHELVVIKTDLADDKLPLKGNVVDESKLKNLGEAHDMKPGKSRKLSLKLKPGHYVLICNQPQHYSQGMHVAFTVER